MSLKVKHLNKIFAVILLLLASLSVCAEPLPNAPSHRFFDKQNLGLHGLNVVANTVDAISTQRMLSVYTCVDWKGYKWGCVPTFGEDNFMARPFVSRGWKGQIVYSYGVGVGGTLLGSYVAHKTGHHKIERLIPMLVGGGTLFLGLKNFTL